MSYREFSCHNAGANTEERLELCSWLGCCLLTLGKGHERGTRTACLLQARPGLEQGKDQAIGGGGGREGDLLLISVLRPGQSPSQAGGRASKRSLLPTQQLQVS